MADQTLSLLLSLEARDAASAVLNGLGQTIAGLNSTIMALNNSTGGFSGGVNTFAAALRPVQPLLQGIATTGVATAAIITGIGVAATEAAAKYQAAGAQLQGTTQMSNTELQKLSDMFLDTAGKSQFSAQQQMQASAQVMGSLKLQGGATLDAADAFTIEQTAEKLAIATHSDLNSATKILVDTMKANNIAVDDADSAFTVLTNTSRLMGTSVQDAGNALNRLHGLTGAPIADIAALGVAVSQTGEGMSGMLVGGIIRLSTVLEDLQSPTKNARKELEALHVQVATNNDGSIDLIETFKRLHDAISVLPPDQQAYAESLLVSKNDIGLFNTLVQEGGGQLQEWKNQITDANSALNQYTKNNETAQAMLARVKAALQDLLVIIGNALLPVLQQWLEKIIPIIATTVQWTQANSSFVVTLLEVIAKIALLVAGAAILLSLLPSIAAAVSLLISPFGAIVIAIAAVVSGVVALPQAFASALTATLQIVGTIVAEIVNLLSYLDPTSHHSPSMVEKVQAGSGQIAGHYQALGAHMNAKSGDFKKLSMGTMGISVADPAHTDAMKKGVQGVVAEHASLVDQMDDHGDDLKKIRKDKISHIDPLARHSPSLLDNIQSGFAQIGDAIENVKSAFETLNEVPGIIDGIQAAVQSADNATSDFITKVDTFAEKFQDSLITKIEKATSVLGGGDGLVTALQSAQTEINKLNSFIDTLNADISTFVPQIDTAKQKMDEWQKTVQKDNEAIQAITEKMQPFQEEITKLQNQISAIQDGTASAVSGLQAQVDTAKTAYDSANFSLKQLNTTLQGTKTQIDNAKSAMQDLLNTSVLLGTNAFNDDQFQLAEKIKQAQLDLVNAKIASGGVDTDQTKALQQQVDLLTLQSQQKQLQRDLVVDPQNRSIQQASQGGPPTEVPYQQLLDQVTAYGKTIRDLTPTLNTQTDAYNAQKAVVDGLKATYDNLNHNLSDLKASLEKPLKIKIDADKAALEPLNAQLKDAQDKLKADEDKLKDYTKQYDELKAKLDAEVQLRDKLKSQRDQMLADLKTEIDLLTQIAQQHKSKGGGGGGVGVPTPPEIGIKGLDSNEIQATFQHLQDSMKALSDPSVSTALTNFSNAVNGLNTNFQIIGFNIKFFFDNLKNGMPAATAIGKLIDGLALGFGAAGPPTDALRAKLAEIDPHFKSLSDEAHKVAFAIGLVVGGFLGFKALSFVGGILGTILSPLGRLFSIMRDLGAGMNVFKTLGGGAEILEQIENPAVRAGVALGKLLEHLKGFGGEALQGIQKVASALGDLGGKNVGNLLPKNLDIKGGMGDAFQAGKGALQAGKDFIAGRAPQTVQAGRAGMTQIIDPGQVSILERAKGLLSDLLGVLKKVGDVIDGKMSKTPPSFEEMGKILGKLVPSLSDFAEGGLKVGSSLLKIGGSVGFLVGLLITGLVGAITVVATHWDQVSKILSDTFKPIWDKVVDSFQDAKKTIEAAIGPLTDKFTEVKDALGPMVKAVMDFVDAFQQWGPVRVIMDAITGVVLALGAAVIGLVAGALQGLANMFGDVLHGAIQEAINIFKLIMNVIKLAADLITGVFKIVTDLIHGNWHQAWEDAKTMVSKVWTDILNIIKNLWDLITGVIGTAFSAIKDLVSGFIQGIINFFQHLWDELVGHSIIPDMLQAIKNAFSGFITAVTQWIADFIDSKIIAPFNRLKDTVINNIWTPLWDTVQDKINTVLSFIHDKIVQPILDKIGDVFDTLRTGAMNLFKLEWDGLQAAINTAKRLIQPVVDWLSGTFTSAINGVRDAAQHLIDIWNTLSGLLSKPLHGVIDLLQNVTGGGGGGGGGNGGFAGGPLTGGNVGFNKDGQPTSDQSKVDTSFPTGPGFQGPPDQHPPNAASGAVILPRLGGTVVNTAEAGEAEAVMPLSYLQNLLYLNTNRGGMGSPIIVHVTGNYILDNATAQGLADKIGKVIAQTMLPAAGAYSARL